MNATPALLEVENLSVEFRVGRGLFDRTTFRALDSVALTIGAGETVGLVGESGSGKSTLARAILRLIPVASGAVRWRGEDLRSLPPKALRARRRELQIVFQDPLASLDPRMTVAAALAEPLAIFAPHTGARERRSRIAAMLERVGLAASLTDRFPHELSGGQCQRVAIARATILGPKLLVCDEAVSSLDVSIRGQIVNLLVDLRKDLNMAMLFISHDLAVVRHVSHRVIVLRAGRVLETGPADTLFAAPRDPYTQSLLAAQRLVAGGDIPLFLRDG
jgi:ABC-type microcin C transport system duplicated ATPase subunit YejF